MSEAVIEEVGKAQGGEPAKGASALPHTPNGLSSESLAKSLAKELRAPAGGKKESSGGAGAKPGTTGSAEGSTAGSEGKDSSPSGTAGSTQSDLAEKVGGGESGKVSGDPEGDGDSGTGKEAWPAAAVSTVTGLRAERRELKAKLEAMEKAAAEKVSGGESGKVGLGAEAEKRQATRVPATSAVQDAGASDAVPKELREAEAEKRQLIGWAREATRRLRSEPDAVLAELDRNGVRVPDRSPEGVADWLAEVRENATTELARVSAQVELARGQATQAKEFERAQAVQVAHEYMPELNEADSPRRQRFEQIMKTHPELETHPRGPLAAMVQVLGMEALDGLMAARKGEKVSGGESGRVSGGKGQSGLTSAATVRAPSKLPNGGGPAPVVASGKKVSSSELLAKYQKSGLEVDKTAWMKSMLG